jgi:hypothetical protein
MPELRPHPYAHRPPRRPLRLPFRRTPPPERAAPPSLRWLLYIGVALAAVLVALAMPYLVSYLLTALGS